MQLFKHISAVLGTAAVFLGMAAAEAQAQFSVGSPTTSWTPVAYAPGVSGDPKLDHQTGQGEGDIVGNTGSATTSLPSFYTHLIPGTSPTTGTLHFRARVGGDQGTAGFKAVLLIGIDANRDGKLDIFVGVDNAGQANGIYIWKPGAQANTSPATMDVNRQTPLKKYTEIAANYHWGAVTGTSATAGVVLDPTADTALRQDFNNATGVDYLLSFSIPFADLVAALSTRGITFTSSTPLTYVMGTATQANSINQDLNNVMAGTSSTLSWAALGALTQPMSANGTIINTAPVNTVPASATVNGSRALSGVSVADAEGNIATVRITASSGTVNVSLTSGASIVAGANGTATLTLGGTQAQINAALATLGYTAPVGVTGSATVTILSTDTSGITDQDSIALTLVSNANSVPVANADTATTHSGKAVTSYVVGNDTDADANILTITSSTLITGAGTISTANGNITFTPSTSYVGNAVINYSISDGLGGTANSTLTVQVSANAVPIAVNDSVNVNPSTINYLSVLANDTDADGDTLSITAATITSGSGTVTILGSELQFNAPATNGTTLISYTISDGFGGTSMATLRVVTGTNAVPVAANDSATTKEGVPVDVAVLANDQDADNDALLIGDAIVTSGSGTAIAIGNLLRFTPAAGFSGTATISYTVEDGRGGSATAVLTVTVTANTAPAVSGESYSTSENVKLEVASPGVLANDVDAEGTTLTASLVTGPAHGTLTLNSDGSFAYTPAAGYAGPDSFTYRASDGSLNSSVATASLTVSAVNKAPTGSGESYFVNEGAILTVNAPGVLSNDSDPDGNALSAVLVGDPAHGTLTLGGDGSFIYEPAAGYSGSDSFTYRVTDGALFSAVLTVNLTVVDVNTAPSPQADIYTVVGGSTLTRSAPGVLTNDADSESDPLTAVLVSGPASGQLTLNANGSFSYTPNAGFTGTDTFTYAATDGVATSAGAQVSIVVTAPPATPPTNGNNPPVVTVALKMATSISTPLAFPVGTSDPDDDTVLLSASKPVNGTIVRTATGFIYTPRDGFAGTDTFTITATDGRGGLVGRVIKVSVTAPDDIVGNYAALLRDANGEVGGHLFFTTTKLGRTTGLLSIKGVRYNFRGFFGGVPSILKPIAKGYPTATLALSMNRANPAGPALVIRATDIAGTFTAETPRSPYSSATPAPQVGKYTIIASRSPLVLGRTGVELSDPGADVPTVGAALTVTVSKIGAAIFVGKAGHGYPLACSSYIMPNNEVPFFAGRNNPGGTIQHSTMVFASTPSTGDTSAPPAVSGVLRWDASRDRRIPEPFTAEYAVLGARYTPPVDGAGLLNAPSVTLSIDETPTFVQAGLPQPYQDTRAFVKNTLPRAVGNIAIVRVNLGNGMFLSAVQGHLPRPIFGVIIQGEGIDRGLGGVVDYDACGTFEILPVR